MKILHIYPRSCEYAYPNYLDPKIDPDKFDLEVMCHTDLEVRYLRGLHELGEDCVLFYPRMYRPPIKEFRHSGGYRIVRFPISFFENHGHWGWHMPLAMLRHIRKERPDLVHFHGITGGRYLYFKFFEIVAYYCWRRRIPFFGWYHVGGFPQGKRFPWLWKPARFFKTKAIRSCAGITSINQEGLSRFFDPTFKDYYGIDFSMVPHLFTPNTIDRQMFYPIPRNEAIARTQLDPNKRYILMVSRLFPQKGLHFLLDIMPRLIKEYPDIHLLIIGDFIEGEHGYRQGIEDQIKNLGLQNRVTFKGRIEHQNGLVNYYNSADVFVLPTQKDTFAGVNLEAIACGIPVVSTDCGEIPHYLKPGLGFVVPNGNMTALETAISRVLSKCFQMDETVRAETLAKYDYRSAAKTLRDWYREIIKN